MRDQQRKFFAFIPIFAAIIGVLLFTALTAPSASTPSAPIDTQRQTTPVPAP